MDAGSVCSADDYIGGADPYVERPPEGRATNHLDSLAATKAQCREPLVEAICSMYGGNDGFAARLQAVEGDMSRVGSHGSKRVNY